MRVPTLCPTCPLAEILVYAELEVKKDSTMQIKAEYLCKDVHKFDVDREDLDVLSAWFLTKNTNDRNIFKVPPKKEE